MPKLSIAGLAAMCLVGFAATPACSSDDGSQFDDAGSSGGLVPDGAFGTFGDAGKPDVDQYANDPPAPWCGPAGQPQPPQPGGTLECPDDKNKPGCPCSKEGETAPCWTGLRKQRHLGACKDGVATCQRLNETYKGWSACEGQVLPKAGATKGAAACSCFSAGQWKIDNTSPCFIDYSAGQTYAVSTVVDGAGKASCPTVANTPPPAVPGSPWSKNSLKVDCAGKFKLCYTLKAGSFDAPSAADCVLATTCTETTYDKENVEQPFPDLPAWVSTDTACAKKFKDSGGYGEMTVVGESVRCDKIDDGSGKALVFNRVRYCELACNANPTLPQCKDCQQGGSGSF